MYRGIIHLHSRYSFDSILTLNAILRTCLREKLNFAILTDHNTIKGSVALRKLAIRRRVGVEVPISAEYATEYGDVIAAFIKKEIKTNNFSELSREVKRQGGILLMPHPYHGHHQVEVVAEQVDLIEVFNGRITPEKNALAQELAKRLNKPGYFASDAHSAISAANVIVEVQRMADLKESLLRKEICPVKIEYTSRLEIPFSQFVKAIKRLDIILLVFSFVQLVVNLAKNIGLKALRVCRKN